VAWFALWIPLTRDKSLEPVWRGSEPSQQSTSSAYAEILSSGQFWRVFVVAILVNPCLYFNLNWLPTYFVQQRGLSATTQLGGILTIIYLGLDLGYLFCGTAVLLLSRRQWPLARARTAVFVLATVLLACSALVPFAPTVEQGVALLVVSNFGAGCWIAMYLTMAQEVSETHVSTAAGLLGGSGSAAGALAMWAVGKVTNVTSSFVAPLVAVAVAAVIAAIAGVAVVRHTRPERAEAVVR
jgi:cyanate permease